MTNVKNEAAITPMLFPYEPVQFWEQLRVIIREEISTIGKENLTSTSYQTNGLNYKPLFKIKEVCDLFQVTRPTIYDWIKHGRLRPYKIRSRVYFLWSDIQQLLSGK